MVKQLQKKFILAAMLAISLLLIVLIGGINIFNYLTVSRENDSLLGMLCNSYEETAFRPFPSQPDEPFIKDNDRHNEFGRPSRDMMKSARYFAAACDSNGNDLLFLIISAEQGIYILCTFIFIYNINTT